MRLRRLPGPHALILCDLDHFKRINDTYGHYSGDCVIRAFADLLKASAPENAVVGRLGGEEFCVLLQVFRQMLRSCLHRLCVVPSQCRFLPGMRRASA